MWILRLQRHSQVRCVSINQVINNSFLENRNTELKARGYKIAALKCRTLDTFIFNVHFQSSGMCVNMGDDPPARWCGLLLKL